MVSMPGVLLRQARFSLTVKQSFIEQIPPGHYLGISTECKELAKAQEDCLHNIIKQILQQIGAEYQIEFEKVIYSKNDRVDITVNDKFSFAHLLESRRPAP